MTIFQIICAIVIIAMVLYAVQAIPLPMPPPLRWAILALCTLLLCGWLASAAGLASCANVRLR